MTTVRKCFISGCENDVALKRDPSSKTSKKLVRYFTPPGNSSEEVLAQWPKVIPPRQGKKEYGPSLICFDIGTHHHVICDRHFEEDCVIKTKRFLVNGKLDEVPLNRWILKKDSVPTKYLNDNCSGDGDSISNDGGVDGAKILTKRRGRGRPSKKKRKSPLLDEIKDDSSSTDTLSLPELQPRSHENHNFKQELDQREFYCSICLETFTADLKFLKLATSRETTYRKFIKLIGNHLQLDFNSIYKKFRFNQNNEFVEDTSLPLTMCDNCTVSVEGICQLIEKIQLLKIKLNDKILEITQSALDQNRGVFLEKQTKLARKLGDGGEDTVKNLVKVIEVINSKRNIFLCPQVTLQRVGHHLLPQQEKKTKCQNFRRNVKVPPPGPSSSKEYYARKQKREEPILFGRTSSLLNDLGFQTEIFCCTVCHKYFSSETELGCHNDTYHLSRRPIATATSAANDDGVHSDGNDDDAISRCPSQGLPEFIDDDNHEDDDMDIAEASTVEHEPDSPVESKPEDLLPEAEIKHEKTEEEKEMRKVPFMSSEYIGKYKVVCKLMNIKTGKTCVGVVAKTKTPFSNGVNATISSQHYGAGDDTSGAAGGSQLPMVISIEPEPDQNSSEQTEEDVKNITTPFTRRPLHKCPIEGCTMKFKFNHKMKAHYLSHKRLIERIQNKTQKINQNTEKRKRGRKPKVGSSSTRIRIRYPKKDKTEVEKAALEKYPCKVEGCDLKFPTNDSISYHNNTRHRPLPCHFCTEMKPNLYELVSHELSEHSRKTPEDPAPSNSSAGTETCPRCGKSCLNFTRRHRLHNHYLSQHFKIKLPKPVFHRPTCTICKMGPFKLQDYIDHMTDVHDQEGLKILDSELPHKCGNCRRRFRFAVNLRHHQKFGQEDCIPKRTFWVSSKKQEQRKERWDKVSEEGFVCDNCGKAFPTYRSLWLHLRVHQPQHKLQSRPRVPCPLNCGITMPNHGMLKLHIRRVHPKEAPQFELDPDKGFVCHQCAKVYAYRNDLKRHINRSCPGSFPKTKKTERKAP